MTQLNATKQPTLSVDCFCRRATGCVRCDFTGSVTKKACARCGGTGSEVGVGGQPPKCLNCGGVGYREIDNEITFNDGF